MPQRFLTDDEIKDLNARGSGSWPLPLLLTLICAVNGAFALGGDRLSLWLFVILAVLTAASWILAVRTDRQFRTDIENRLVEVLEGAPQRVWRPGRNGPCYLRIANRNIRVPGDRYQELKESPIANVEFLPTSNIAVRVRSGRGIAAS